jgi:hypothetical protein
MKAEGKMGEEAISLNFVLIKNIKIVTMTNIFLLLSQQNVFITCFKK